jgi:DNA-directed RNA polymerase subunit RPC12/RpoP
MARMLSCPNLCEARRFEALNAPLYVDPSGKYIEHDAKRAAYVCVECGSVAIDVAAAMREAESARAAEPQTLTCPGCGTEMLPPEDDPLAAVVECPICETRFSIEEGSPSLHGASRYLSDDADPRAPQSNGHGPADR